MVIANRAITAVAVAVLGVAAANAGVVEDSKALLGQKKYDEAYAAIEKEAGNRDASADVLATGMRAAQESGRIVIANRLAKRLVRATDNKNATVLYACAEIAVLTGDDEAALARYRNFIDLSDGKASAELSKALDYVLPRGNFPGIYRQAMAVHGPTREGMFERGEQILGHLWNTEEYDQALELAELLCRHYGGDRVKAEALAAAIGGKLTKYEKQDDVRRIVKMLAGCQLNNNRLLWIYGLIKDLPVNERLDFLFGKLGTETVLEYPPRDVSNLFGAIRLPESSGDRLRYGKRYLAMEPAYRAHGAADVYDGYLWTILDSPTVFNQDGQPLVDAARATAMFDAAAAMRNGALSWETWTRFRGRYLSEDPATEEILLRKYLPHLPLHALRRLVDLTEGKDLATILAQYSGGFFGKTMDMHAGLLQNYDELKLKDDLFKAARARILENPVAFDVGAIQRHFCNSAAAPIPEKAALLLDLLNRCGHTRRFEELADALAADKMWNDDPGFKQFQQDIKAKKKGTDPFLSAYAAALAAKVEARNQPNKELEVAVRKAMAAFPGSMSTDPAKAANETAWLAGKLLDYYLPRVWDNQSLVIAAGEMWIPKFDDIGPLWDEVVGRIGGGRGGFLWKLAPRFIAMIEKGAKPSERSWAAFAGGIHPKDDQSVLFEKYYGRMGRYARGYVYNQRYDAWAPELVCAQLEKALSAGTYEGRSAQDVKADADMADWFRLHARPRVAPPVSLIRRLCDEYKALLAEGDGDLESLMAIEDMVATAQGATAQDSQVMRDRRLQRIAAMERPDQVSELSRFTGSSPLLDAAGRAQLLTTTFKAQVDGMQASEWARVRLDPAVLNRIGELGEGNAVADQLSVKLMAGVMAGARPRSSDTAFLGPLREQLLEPFINKGQWVSVLRTLDRYSRLLMTAGNWDWCKQHIDSVMAQINEAEKPEIAYAFTTMILNRAVHSREQVEAHMLALRAQASKNIPGLIPVEKGDPSYDLYVAASAVAARDEEHAWVLTRPRLELLRKEWPTHDADFVAWVVRQMHKQRMLKEALEFCSEILLKEYDLPTKTAAALLLTKGDIYRDMENFRAARVEYQSLYDNKRYQDTPAYGMSKYRLIELLIETGEFGTAEDKLARMVDAPSLVEQAEAYYLLGKTAYEQEDYVQSRDYLTETFKRVHGHPEGRLLEGELKLRLPRGLASTEVQLGRLDLQTVVVPGRMLALKLRDTNLSIAQGGQSIPVSVSTSAGGDREDVKLVVSPADSTLFIGSISTTLGKPVHNNLRLEISGADQVSYIIDPAYQKANDISYPAKVLEVRSDARLVASSGEFLTPEEEDRRRMEFEMRRAKGLESVRSMERGTVVRPGSAVYVQVTDLDRDMGEQKDSVAVDVRTSSGDLVEAFTLTETETHSGVFEGKLTTGVPLPLVRVSDVVEGMDPNAIINSTKTGSWVSQPDGVRPKWVDVDTMSSHEVKEVVIRMADVNRIKSMSVEGMLDVDPINLGRYWANAIDVAPGGVLQLFNSRDSGPEAEAVRAALKEGGEVSQLSGMRYSRADTRYKGQNAWLNVRLFGSFWADDETTLSFKFLQPESSWQYAYLFIDGQPVLGGRMDGSGLARTKEVALSAGIHTMEVLMRDHWSESEVIVGVRQQEGAYAPMPASLFSVADNPEMADLLRPRGKVSKRDDGFAVTLDEPQRLRSVRFIFDDFLGDGLSVSDISMTAADGTTILPMKDDFSTALENDTLEIAAGDQIVVSYADEKNLHDKTRNLRARLSAQYFNGRAGLFYEGVSQSGGQGSHAAAVRVLPGDQLLILVTDFDMDVSDDRDTIPATVTTAGGAQLELTLLEGAWGAWGARMANESHTGIFGEILKLGDVTGKNTIKMLAEDTITVTYLDKENTSPGIPVPRSVSVDTAPDDAPVISVYPTRMVREEDTSEAAATVRLKLEKAGRKDVTIMRDKIVAGAGVVPDEPVRVSVRTPIVFSVQHQKAALHAGSRIHIQAVAESELAAARREGREPVVTTIPLEVDSPRQASGKKGYAVEFSRDSMVADPLMDGIFSGVIRLQLGSPGDQADSLIRVVREFSADSLASRPDAKVDLLSSGRVATIVVRGSDTVHLSVKDDSGQVLTKGAVKLLSDATLELMDLSYTVENSAVHIGQRFCVRVTDPDRDLSDDLDAVKVTVKGPNDSVELTLTESMPHSGVFTAQLEPRLMGGVAATGVTTVAGIDVALGDELMFAYNDDSPLQGDGPVLHEVSGRIHHGADGNLFAFSKRFQDPDVAVKTRFLMAEAMFEMAKHHRKVNQLDLAIEELAQGKRILEEAMRDYPETKHVVQGEYLLANLAQELEEYNEAVGRYSNIIVTWPDSEYAIRAQLKKAICYEKLGQADQSAEEYVRLTYMYPDSSYVADATVRLANQYYKLENYKTAGRIFKQFHIRHPDHKMGAKALFLAGQCSMKLEDFEEAVVRFKDLVRAYPDDKAVRAEGMYWLGDTAFQSGDYSEAYKAFKQLTWDYPETKWAKIARGRLTDGRFIYEE